MSSPDVVGKPAPEIEGRTFEFALRIIKVCLVLNECPGVRRTLGNQLLRAGTSVGANVTEAQAAKLLAEGQLGSITQEADEIKRILGAIVRTARRNQADA